MTKSAQLVFTVSEDTGRVLGTYTTPELALERVNESVAYVTGSPLRTTELIDHARILRANLDPLEDSFQPILVRRVYGVWGESRHWDVTRTYLQEASV